MNKTEHSVKILCWCEFAADRIEAALRTNPCVRLQRVRSLEEFAQHIEDADGALLIGVDGFYSAAAAEIIRNAPARFRWIQNMTAGYDGLTKHGVRAGISVTLARGSNAISVAEHGFALLLALTRAIPLIVDNQRRHQWSHNLIPKLWSLEGKTLCVLGIGAIGMEMARLATAFHMRVIGVARTDRRITNIDVVFQAKALRQALSQTDVLCVTVPLTAETHHMIAGAELDALGPNGYLVNIGRGAIVDSEALDRALRQGTIAGAALDVTDPEPLPGDHPLWSAPNALISPHIAGYGSQKSFERLVDLVVENITRFVQGDALLHPLDFRM
jgi:phosphoglycerate dehydrogenase-like enzyme